MEGARKLAGFTQIKFGKRVCGILVRVPERENSQSMHGEDGCGDLECYLGKGRQM